MKSEEFMNKQTCCCLGGVVPNVETFLFGFRRRGRESHMSSGSGFRAAEKQKDNTGRNGPSDKEVTP